MLLPICLDMSNQLGNYRSRRKPVSGRSANMAIVWLSLSSPLSLGVRAAFSRSSCTFSKTPAFAGRTNPVGKTLGVGVGAGAGAGRWSFHRGLAATSTLSDPKSSEYDLINKDRGLQTYTPSEFESEIYSWWENSGCFQPDAKQPFARGVGEKPYVLPMPPPNVTGRLHMGHAIFVALQDVLARFHRMRGRPVLWLPGRS